MKKITLIVFSILFSQQTFSQGLAWAKQFNGPTGFEGGYSIAIDNNGNVYTSGTFDNPTDFDPGPGTYLMNCWGFDACFVSKLDAFGNFIWAKQLAEQGLENRAFSNTVDASGNAYTSGDYMATADFDPGPATYNLTALGGTHDIFVSKLDAAGNFVWAKSMGGTSNEAGMDIQVDNNGNVYTTGYFLGTADFDPGPATYNLNNAGDWDFFVSKLDASGNFVWARAFGSSGFDYGACLHVDISGNVYTIGRFNGTVDFDPGPGVFNLMSFGNSDIFISKLDGSGNFVWAKQMGGTGGDAGSAITMNSNGDIFITGSFGGTADFDPGPATYNLTSTGLDDIFICKLDASGNIIWAKSMGSVNSDGGNAIVVDAYRIYTRGVFQSISDFDPGAGIYNLTSAGLSDIFISTLDTSGNFISAVSMGGPDSEFGNGLALSPDGSLYLTGWIYDTADFDPGPNAYNLIPSGGSDAFIVKLSDIPTSIGETESEANDISVFPNPATSELVVQSSEFGEIESIEIYSSLGEKVFSQSVISNEKQVTISVADFPSGIYFITVTDQIGNKVTKKVVKL